MNAQLIRCVAAPRRATESGATSMRRESSRERLDFACHLAVDRADCVRQVHRADDLVVERSSWDTLAACATRPRTPTPRSTFAYPTDGRPHLDKIRRACRENLRRSLPARLIAIGVSPPRGGGDDDAWESLCELFESLDCDKEYWSKDDAERQRMARYGFKGHDGYFDELVRAL